MLFNIRKPIITPNEKGYLIKFSGRFSSTKFYGTFIDSETVEIRNSIGWKLTFLIKLTLFFSLIPLFFIALKLYYFTLGEPFLDDIQFPVGMLPSLLFFIYIVFVFKGTIRIIKEAPELKGYKLIL